MELTKKQTAVKYLFYALIILAAHLLQNIDGLFLQIGSARCFLLLPAAIILAMGEDEKIGALIGLGAGLLWDLNSGVHMGFNCIFIMIFCFFSSALITYIARNTFITNLLCSSAAVIFYCVTYWLCFIVIKGVEAGEITLLTFYLPSMIYTITVTPLLWLIINPIKNKFNIE